MITALISKKGGVGKTTTAVNLAAALAGIGKRVLLVDLDSQASSSLSLGVSRAALAPSIADVVLRSVALKRTVRATQVAGLDLVTASADLSSVDVELASTARKETFLSAALRPVENDYDFILLDCPSSLSLIPVSALVAADNFIVPVVPQFLSVIGVRNLLGTAERLHERFGTRTELLGLVLTMVDYRTKTSRENVLSIRRRYSELVFAVEIRTNTRLAEAPAKGQTIFQFDSSSVGARAYRLLAAEVLMRASAAARHERQETSGLHRVRA